MERLYRLDEASRILGVSIDTLRKWDRLGKIKTIRTQGGHRRIPWSEIKRILQIKDFKQIRCAIYARVSSSTRKDDLDRQLFLLRQYAKENNYLIIKEITDIASGLKETRRGLRNLIKLAQQNRIDVILITYKDRLARFGYRYLVELFKSYNVQIIPILEKPPKDSIQELVEDFVAIITSFAGKIYGRRSKKLKKLLELFS